MFLEWVENGMDADPIWSEYDWEAKRRLVRWLLDRLQDCTDVLPGWCCADLVLDQGSTYGVAVRKVASEIDLVPAS